MKRRTWVALVAVVALVTTTAVVGPVRRRVWHPIAVRLAGRHTVAGRAAEFSAAGERIRDACGRAGVGYPPGRVVLLGLKDERQLVVYAGPAADALRPVTTVPILAASGRPGPKLRAGDDQVPEGIYSVESLNPDSAFHVALRVGYPNAFDRRMAARDGRSDLGGDIMIHGGTASVGCLAVGDAAAEDLFVLAAAAGVANVTVVLAPADLRTRPVPADLDLGWRRDLYRDVRAALSPLPPVR